MSYADEFRASIDDPAAFWAEKANALDWYRKPEQILSRDEHGIDHWFADGELNTCHLAIDYHVDNGRADQLALIYDSPVTGQQRKYSFRQLRDEIAKCAGMLANHGVGKGDRVVIYLPMIAEAVISMLACARIGAVHSVVFGGFAPPELAVRLDDATPKVLLTASCGIEINRVIEYKPIVDAANHALDVASEGAELEALVNESFELLSVCRSLRTSVVSDAEKTMSAED